MVSKKKARISGLSFSTRYKNFQELQNHSNPVIGIVSRGTEQEKYLDEVTSVLVSNPVIGIVSRGTRRASWITISSVRFQTRLSGLYQGGRRRGCAGCRCNPGVRFKPGYRDCIKGDTLEEIYDGYYF